MTKDAEITEIIGRTICPGQCHVICSECTRTAHEIIRNLRDQECILCKPRTPGYEAALAAAVNSYYQYLDNHKGDIHRVKLEAMNAALSALWRVVRGRGV